MKWLRRKLMRFLVEHVDGVAFKSADWKKMDLVGQRDYLLRCADLKEDSVLLNEINLILNTAKTNLIRNTKDDVEIAWNRGGIHALETLQSRFKLLESRLNETIKKELRQKELEKKNKK